MVNTNSKEIIEKNKRHIIRQFGSKKDWYDTMLGLIKVGRGMTPYEAALTMAMGGDYLVYTEDIINYLHRLGLKDDKQLMGYRAADGSKGPDTLYFHLMARDGERLFNDITKDLMKKEKAKKSR